MEPISALAAATAALIVKAALEEGGKDLWKGTGGKVIQLVRDKFETKSKSGIIVELEEEPSDENKSIFEKSLSKELIKDEKFAERLQVLLEKLKNESPQINEMLSHLEVEGVIVVGDMLQEQTNGGGQKMATNLKAKSIKLGNLTQKSTNQP